MTNAKFKETCLNLAIGMNFKLLAGPWLAWLPIRDIQAVLAPCGVAFIVARVGLAELPPIMEPGKFFSRKDRIFCECER